jgi:hypothetical protein
MDALSDDQLLEELKARFTKNKEDLPNLQNRKLIRVTLYRILPMK